MSLRGSDDDRLTELDRCGRFAVNVTQFGSGCNDAFAQMMTSFDTAGEDDAGTGSGSGSGSGTGSGAVPASKMSITAICKNRCFQKLALFMKMM